MSKGSKRRESQVTSEELEQRWNKCFGNMINKPTKHAIDINLDNATIGSFSGNSYHCKPTPESINIYESTFDIELDKQNERINRNKVK